MNAVELLPDVPELRAPAGVVAWLVATDGEQAATPAPEALTDSDAMAGGALHPQLAAMRSVVESARIDLFLERGERRGRGWLGESAAVLAHPLPDGRERLLVIRIGLLLDALVRLNDIGPRPRVEPAVRVAARPADLAQALAARDPGRLAGLEPEQAEAFRGLVGGLREHWRVAVRWDPAEGAPGGRDLEVLDTDGGYWTVIPDDPTVELWPTTPTAVFRALCRLFPAPSEVREWTAPR